MCVDTSVERVSDKGFPTRFLIGMIGDCEAFKREWIDLPNLVAVLAHYRQLYHPAEKLEVWLRKPITAATLFGIIASSIARSPPSIHPSSPVLWVRNTVYASDPSQFQLLGSGLVREISMVNAKMGACLLEDPMFDEKWKTPFQPVDTKFIHESDNGQNEQGIQTIFEIFKLTGRHCDPDVLSERSDPAKPVEWVVPHAKWNLKVTLTMQQYMAFAEMVSRGVYCRLISTYTDGMLDSFPSKSPLILESF
jgi:hypothetical protein